MLLLGASILFLAFVSPVPFVALAYAEIFRAGLKHEPESIPQVISFSGYDWEYKNEVESL